MIAACICFGCIHESNGDDSNRKTNSGYVAFDYTCNSFRNYVFLLKQIYRFNQYYIQPTLAQRDSVDKLYFRDAKIVHYEDDDKWTIYAINTYSNPFVVSITTNGKSIDEKGCIWTISNFDPYYNSSKTFEFDVENKDGTWRIPEHDNKNDGTFEYTTEWNIKFDDDGKSYVLEGAGSLLSVRSPKLKLDYTITEPIHISEYKYSEYDYYVDVSSGKVKIFATDIEKNLTEETNISIFSNNDIEVVYNNHRETWGYRIFDW
jgi:hypothetical protein